MSAVSIPILDFSSVNISLKDSEIKTETFCDVGKDLITSLFDVGFLFVTNHGVPIDDINSFCELSKNFFNLPPDVKLKRARNWKTDRCGYLPIPEQTAKTSLDNERFDFSKPHDLKEVFDLCHNCGLDIWPEHELPCFKQASKSLIKDSQSLINRLLLLLGHGLTPDNPNTFVDGFKGFATKSNTSQLRCLHYPKLEHPEIKDGQSRCGEHTDYGTLTLVFMDSTPGLQVYTRQGSYIDVNHMDGAILVNIGDLMQRWSGDQLRSAKHRVIFRPETLKSDRYSLVYFSHPDEEVVISPIIGAMDKYPPISTKDHMDRRFKDTFQLGKGLDEELTEY